MKTVSAADFADLTLDELRVALAPDIAASAIFDGWNETALIAAAEMAGCDTDVARLAFADSGRSGLPMAMIEAWIASVDQAMEAEWPAERLATLKIRERIRTLVAFRLDAVADIDEAVRRALAVARVLGALETGTAPAAAPPRPASAPPRAAAPPPEAAPAPVPPPVASARPEPSPASLAASLDDDIASLLQGALDAAPAGPPSPLKPEDELERALGPDVQRILAAADHFAVLGTSWQDAPEQHRRAYFRIAQRFHPDRLGDASEAVRVAAADAFERARVAWEELGDDARREAYIARVVRGEKSEEELAMEKVRRILDAESDFKRGPAELGAGRAVLSVSPELFLSVDAHSRSVRTRPIKGTRAADGCAAELERCDKERAELHMIVDLMRNDLGRVCSIGSVRVSEPRSIERHPTVQHAVAEVSGTLRPGIGHAELLRATFPPGSVTGAPKVRAMQIIDELEPFARGPYCGALGWLGDDGAVALNVAIRTFGLEEVARELVPEVGQALTLAREFFSITTMTGSGSAIVSLVGAGGESAAIEQYMRKAVASGVVVHQVSL